MLKRIKKRMETGVLVAAIVIPVALCVFAFLGVACYFALLESLPPAMAALVTAACGIVVIALVLLVAKIADGSGKRTEARQGRPPQDDEFERFLREHADPVLARWIQDNPDKAAMATLGLGIAAGYSEPFRRVLFDLYVRYSESETVRRSRPDAGR
ncbi:phage holin family protein [Wenzhouxiangella sediminis]|uniref:Uncharacterized protein n=1 Tax=Wenzhouxiangella sediminis TaxID=1792836 RepID=A0A3E1K963_9GAMM|nr:phage holin family protein [Wenzhouxiangella sediminis]RFF30680.1 hypothetical protein DZC52_07035 [Wenzhouxiangella sediminis]